jgi:sugar lactone lactonase YvrE
VAWNDGRGRIVYDSLSASFTYDYPGIYTIGLSAWTASGVIQTDYCNVNVDYAHRDLMVFSNIPDEYGLPGLKTNSTFVVSVTSAKIDSPIGIVLQSINSQSVPWETVPDKWNFLVPRWRFVDADTNQNLEAALQVETRPIYRGSKVVAVSGIKSFYYIDDLATGTDPVNDCPLLLVATLSTEHFVYPPESLVYPYTSYSNSEITRATILWQIRDVVPSELKVTENYLSEVYPIKWKGVPIPVMITCKFDPAMFETFEGSRGLSATDVLSYPRTNELGSITPVTIVLSSENGVVDSSLYSLEHVPLFFQSTDSTGSDTRGYLFTSVTPLTTFENSLTVAVSTIAQNKLEGEGSFSYPDGYPIYVNAYISHPYGHTINRIQTMTYPSNCESIQYYKSQGSLVEGRVSNLYVSPLTDTSENYELSGMAGVYAMAFNPTNNSLYAADADRDVLYLFSGTEQQPLSSVYLSSVTGNEYNTPSYISVDSESNVWVALFNRQVAWKFSKSLVPLLSVSLFDESVRHEEFDDLPLDFVDSPPIAETDKDDNLWYCTSHQLSSCVAKFDKDGNHLFNASGITLSSCPVSLAVDEDNSIWVACNRANSVVHVDSNGNLISTIENEFIRPSYIVLDRSKNVWVLHSFDLISRFDVETESIDTWQLNGLLRELKPYSLPVSGEDLEKALHENEVWGGLATDVLDRVWVVDSLNNIAVVFNPTEPVSTYRAIGINPERRQDFIITTDGYQEDIDVEIPARSAQATGDWTGNRWYQKYSGKYNKLNTYGVSTPFRVYDLDTTAKIAKVNEGFDVSAYMRSLALPEVLQSNEFLFNDFLGAMCGNGDLEDEDLGETVYEKVANFVQAHADIDTVDIPQLVSLATAIRLESKRYGVDFPSDVQRLLNLFSIPRHKLIGRPRYSLDIQDNLRGLITATDILSAGEHLCFRDRLNDRYLLVYVSPLEDDSTVFPLSQLNVGGVRLPVWEHYDIFRYEQAPDGYIDNVIDWGNPFTTITPNVSTYEQWYGKDGIVEVAFNSLLTRKLFVE